MGTKKPDLTRLLLDLAQVKAEEEALAARKAAAELALIEGMNLARKKGVAVQLDNGDEVKGTLVEAQRVVYDEQALEVALADKWSRVTKTTLDTKKLEAAIALGDVDPNVVAVCSEVRDNKPYVKITGHKGLPAGFVVAGHAPARVAR